MTTYTSTTINESPTITLVAGEDISKAQGKAVKIVDGKAVAATDGVNAMGIILLSEEAEIKKGTDVTVQIKDIGSWVVGESVNIGDELTSGVNGVAMKAAKGKFITAIALTSAGKAGTVIRAQIVKAGYKA